MTNNTDPAGLSSFADALRALADTSQREAAPWHWSNKVVDALRAAADRKDALMRAFQGEGNRNLFSSVSAQKRAIAILTATPDQEQTR